MSRDLFCIKQSKELLQTSITIFTLKWTKKNLLPKKAFQFPLDKLQQPTVQKRSHTIILLETVLLGSA